MPRFRDDWVITKSLFEYTTGGSCACCSFPATLFDPDGIKGLINSISDLETDDADQEIKAATGEGGGDEKSQSPWPIEMRDSIWSDRVKVRYKMKKEMNRYKEFWVEGIRVESDSFNDEVRERVLLNWCKNELGWQALRRIFQMPRSEITDILSSRYGVCPAYGTVMCAVVEQVANFGLTKYEIDARGKEEIEFEKMLRFSKRGGFMFCITDDDDENNDEILLNFIKMIKSLKGPKLLQRGLSTSTKNVKGDENDDAEGDGDGVYSFDGCGPSFRSDRRIARLVIAKYWADQIIAKYETLYKKEQEQK